MNRRFLLLALAALAALPTARAADGRSYTPGAFEALDINGSAVVRFVQGDSDQVFVEGDEEVQRAVSLDVRAGTLHVRPSGAWKFWNDRRAQIVVTARNLRRVSISGAADLLAAEPVRLDELAVSISGAGLARFDQLNAGELKFQVSGAGDGQIAGTTKALSISISGRSSFRGANLRTDSARVSISGVGDVEVWVRESLSVSVAGAGTVDYWGNPDVKRSVAGRATINARGAK